MKVLTIFGTRPEIIRLSQVIPRLDALCDHMTVHTGQNYDRNLSDVFFEELGVRPPDVHLGIKQSGFGEQASQIIASVDALLAKVAPDRVLILGDTNSGLAAIPSARRGIPVYHMEAGNRCYDDRVPEELNRRLIDHSSAVLMPYTDRSKDNLVREGIARQRIFVTGNPIYEVLNAYSAGIEASGTLARFGVSAGAYFLATLHRAENVDDPSRLRSLLSGLTGVAERYGQPLIFSVHPRTADQISRMPDAPRSPLLRVTQPLGFFDFVKLERHARCVLSDSGTVQEECCVFGVPNVTVRDVTERAETIEVGSSMLSGAGADDIGRAVDAVLVLPHAWIAPPEYTAPHVSATVTKVVLGFRWGRDV